jgi:hypothetical protein
MSVTFEAMLMAATREADAMRELNLLLAAKDSARRQGFVEIDMSGAGGSKSFCSKIYAACFNHLAPGDVEECICAAPWRGPDWVLYVYDLGDYYYGEGTSLRAQTVQELRSA